MYISANLKSICKNSGGIVANPSNPLIIQSDSSLLLEVYNEKFEIVRNELTKFAELIKSPEHIHTYKISALSLWNAAAAGVTLNGILDFLNTHSKFDLPQNVMIEIKTIYNRFGIVEIVKYEQNPTKLILNIKDSNVEKEIISNPKLKKFLIEKIEPQKYLINLLERGDLKIACFNYNIPVYDIAGYTDGEPLDIKIRDVALSGHRFKLRDYQLMAADAFYMSGTNMGGHGTIVLPCGAGKTIVGIDIMSKIKTNTLILCTSVSAVHQWIREILDKTHLTENEVGEYTGDKKEIKSVTVCTYQILIYRKSKEDDFTHFSVFQSNKWGFIIYDEVHLLPAPIFKITGEIQSTRRLGLTATLVREDEHEKDVFCLIGPKKFDTPWKVLEKQGWISEAKCFEIKLPLPKEQLMEYLIADQKVKFNIAAKNTLKYQVVKDILLRHYGLSILVIGHFIDQLKEISEEIKAPLITGKTVNSIRDQLYKKFRNGEHKVLVVSKVANFSIDLPEASVLIQLSGTYGSRQEEAQRLGRILRPKENNVSYFYSLTTRDSIEEEYAHKRQRFLAEQGYSYEIDFWKQEEIIWDNKD
ncbi:MAG: helicase [Spirochaetes bacterium GWD1_27_9]|nr:MAG: helicase [Spirochaetes bacterium GWB1_27_13]OHD25616.1 MAG: helicase [Spirochaetes bacterium GWC1_27_15]OHD42226.1 MAG: helicase [Spirochaetes bacterium GWD1_27_9]